MYITKDTNAAPKQRTNIVPAFIDFSHHLQIFTLNPDEMRRLTRFRGNADGELRYPAWESSETATRPHRAIARCGGGPTTP